LGERLETPSSTLYFFQDSRKNLFGYQPRPGENALIINSEVRTGEQILNSAEYLRELGLGVHFAVVFVVRPTGKKYE
jgi:orotate phosphoribosyltransferase